jgi:hypothetical protein
VPFDLSAEHVLPLLESDDRAWASDARAAWDWLTASGDAPVVNLHDLERFLWYQLPAKFLTGPGHHRAVAGALGDLLSDLGYEDGAALCRGPVTMHVLAEWEKGRSSGYRAFRKTMEESGVEPPDTDALHWGSVRGMVEAGVFEMASSDLERALAEGAFTPGARGWKRAQAEVMRRFVATPLHSLDERTPQAAVWEERRQRWAEPPGRPLRKAFLHNVSQQMRRPPDTPIAPGDHPRPLLRLLEIAGTGPALMQAGYLPPRVVQDLVREFGWWHLGKPPRSEADAPEVMELMAFAKEAALVRRARGSLRLTELGRRAASDPAALWERVVKVLAEGEDFASVIRELFLVRLLQGASEHGLIEEEILPVLAEARWKPSDGGELTPRMVSSGLWDSIRADEASRNDGGRRVAGPQPASHGVRRRLRPGHPLAPRDGARAISPRLSGATTGDRSMTAPAATSPPAGAAL